VHVPSAPSHASGAPADDEKLTTDITIRGDVATATFSPSAGVRQNAYFRKEGGAWKVCQSATQAYYAATK
jgi:hypothetical protein